MLACAVVERFSELSTLTRPPPLFACITDVSVENKPLRELFVELLLRLGADPNAVDAGGLSAADTARAACFDEAVELLQRWSGPVEPREGEYFVVVVVE